MNEIEMPQLIKHLVDNDSFINVANSIFSDGFGLLDVDELFLLQISADGMYVNTIASISKNGVQSKSINNKKLSDMDFLKDEIVTFIDKADENGYIYAPVFIRNRTAMYVGARLIKKTFTEEQIKIVSDITLIIQNIASRKNFEDSLENSYKLLEDILNEIPIAIAVLNKDEKNVLLMNDIAADSEAVQNAMGIGLSEYLENGETDIDEIFENETGLWFDVQFKVIKWINEDNVLLCTAIDVTQKMKNQQRIEYQANNDYLTGLFNRMKCERDLVEIVNHSIETKNRGVLIFLDLDNFKQVNDGLGHQYGDVLLQEISAGIQSIPQIANSCYRMGGDEFVIIIRPEMFSEITHIVDEISGMFNRPWKLMDIEYYCTMSMGLAIFPDYGIDAQDIIKKADIAMYEAKKSGKNRYLWYQESKNQGDEERRILESELKKDILNGCSNFEIYYQPVIDNDNVITAAEALIRYNSPKFGFMQSSEFMSVIEYLGLVNYIGDFVFNRACQKLKEWNDSVNDRLKMHVNISAIQLMAENAVDRFINVIHKYKVNPENIVLDLSETSEFRDKIKAFATLDILRVHGLKVALDDFGTGSISLDLLRRLDTYVVKLDPSFVQNAEDDLYRYAIIKTVCNMSKELGFEVCFEGVETQEQKEFAQKIGADLMEGYLFGRAVCETEFFEKLKGEKNNAK